jgi:hypothetical protein
MALTREERQTIMTLVKRVNDLETQIETLQKRIIELKTMANTIDAESNILDWSGDQLDEWLKPYILKYMVDTGTKLPMHNHKNNQQGGACFAKLGANLID